MPVKRDGAVLALQNLGVVAVYVEDNGAFILVDTQDAALEDGISRLYQFLPIDQKAASVGNGLASVPAAHKDLILEGVWQVQKYGHPVPTTSHDASIFKFPSGLGHYEAGFRSLHSEGGVEVPHGIVVANAKRGELSQLHLEDIVLYRSGSVGQTNGGPRKE